MENFKTYDKIYRLGHNENSDIFKNPTDSIVIQEKMDGANFRFTIIGNKIVLGSRTQQLTSDSGDDTNIDKNFKRAAIFVREILKDKQDYFPQLQGLVFYMENMVKHTMNYEWEKVEPVLGFDIFNMKTGNYFPLGVIEPIFRNLGFKMVPLIDIKYAQYFHDKKIDDNMVPVSEYAPRMNPQQKAEGIVFKNYNKQVFAKYVRDEFKEENSKVFGGKPKYNKKDDTNNSEFIFKYCTNQRIEKVIFKLLDQGKELDMKLMGDCIKQVYLDIIEENWQEILLSNWKLDLKLLRKGVAPRVRAVLNQVITNNKLMEETK